MVYLIVSGAVIVPFTSSAWFCDVTVYFIPSTWTCVRWRPRPMQKPTDGCSSIHSEDRYPPKTTINPQVNTWIVSPSLCVGARGAGLRWLRCDNISESKWLDTESDWILCVVNTWTFCLLAVGCYSASYFTTCHFVSVLLKVFRLFFFRKVNLFETLWQSFTFWIEPVSRHSVSGC